MSDHRINGHANGTANGHANGHATRPPSDRLPPHNILAETSVLGGILLDRSQFATARAIIGPDDFFRSTHRDVYRALIGLADRGEPIDLTTLHDELTRLDLIDDVGGIEGLATLARDVPHAVNTEYYARIVREKANARRLIQVLNKGLEDTYANKAHSGRLIARMCRRVERLAGMAESGPGDGPEAIMVRLADVTARPVNWLWPSRIPLGKVTLCAGEIKLGKSFFTMFLAAAVSTGAEVPCAEGECFPSGSVVLLSAEDDLEDTIKPRLETAGADCTRIHALTTLRRPDGSFEPFTLAYLPLLEDMIDRIGDVRLLVLDPITQYIGGGVDDHKVVQLRAVLGPLKDLAARRGIAVVIISHMNKGTNPKAINRVTGSGGYTALARSNWLFLRDPEDPKRRLMLDGGTNIVEEPTGLAYRIKGGKVEWEPDAVTLSADEVVALVRERAGPESKADRAEAWLGMLFVPGVEIPSQAILAAGEASGFKRNAMFDAKKKLNIRARKVGDSWAWYRDANQDDSTVGQLDVLPYDPDWNGS